MKSTERHRLKENEFARTVGRARELLETRRRDMTAIVLVLVAAILLAGGYGWWRQARNAKANTMLAAALAVAEAPVVAPTPPAPGSPIPIQQPGTFQTERAKLEAALPKFLEVADKYPNAARRDHRALPRRGRPRLARAPSGSGAAVSGSDRQGGKPHLRPHGAARSGGRADRASQVRQRDQDSSGAEHGLEIRNPGRRRADGARARLHEGRKEERSGARLQPRRRRVPAVALRRRRAQGNGRSEEEARPRRTRSRT